jgi:hypothetical protein
LGQRRDVSSCPQQMFDEMRADEAVGSGDQNTFVLQIPQEFLPLSLEDRFHGKVESWQQICREVVLFAELPDPFDSVGSQLRDREGARFRVDNPEFFDSGARIFQFLVHLEILTAEIPLFLRLGQTFLRYRAKATPDPCRPTSTPY